MPLQLDPLEGIGGFGGLEGLERPFASGDGQPLLLAIALIDEDPGQPRQEFEPQALQELAESIAEHGVLQPVSVHARAEAPGRWMLNMGARRLRASMLAGKADIPAFVDKALTGYAQVTENEQRAGLTPMELALFVQRRLAEGDSQAEIARRLSKSKQYITYATALIDAPEWLLAAYRDKRCRGLRELYELRRLHGERPAQVDAWMSDQQQVTRQRVEDLRAILASPLESATLGEMATSSARGAASADVKHLDSANRQRRLLTLQADWDGQTVAVVVDAVPSEPGCVFVRGGVDQRPQVVAASRLKLIGFAVG